MLPLFNQYLKDGPAVTPPAATIYNTGENHWDRFSEWPLACESGLPAPLTPIYLGADGGSASTRAGRGGTAMSPIPPSRSRTCRARSISTTGAGATGWCRTSATPTAAPT